MALDDKELRLMRYMLNHKEIGSKASIFSVSEAAEYLGISEEEVVELIEKLKSKGMIKPLVINLSPEVHLSKVENLNARYMEGRIDEEEYVRSWRKIEDEMGIEAVSSLPISLVELEEHIKAISDLLKAMNELEGGLGSGLTQRVSKSIRGRINAHMKAIEGYLTFCVWRAKGLYSNLQSIGSEGAVRVMASYLYKLFPNIISLGSAASERADELREKVKLQEEIVRTLREMSPARKQFLSDLLREEERKLEKLREELSSIKEEKRVEIKLSKSIEEACEEAAGLIGPRDEDLIHQMRRSLFMLLALKDSSKYRVGKLELSITDSEGNTQIEVVLTPYDTPNDIFRELLREHLDEYPRIRRYTFTTPQGEVVPVGTPIESPSLSLVIERSPT